MAKSTPTNKVAAGGITGAVSLILVWAVGLAGLEVPAEVAAAFTAVLAFAASYLVREKDSGKHVAGQDVVPATESRGGISLD